MKITKDYIFVSNEDEIFLNTFSLYCLFLSFLGLVRFCIGENNLAEEIFLPNAFLPLFYIAVLLFLYVLRNIYKEKYESLYIALYITALLVLTYFLGHGILYFQLMYLSTTDTVCLVIRGLLTAIVAICMILNDRLKFMKIFNKIAYFTFAILISYLFNNKIQSPVLGCDLFGITEWYLNLCAFVLSYPAIRLFFGYKSNKNDIDSKKPKLD